MAKSGITWNRTDEEGQKLEVNASQNGPRWVFLSRARRYDDWKPFPEPTEEDWLELVDAVERRVQRGLMRAEVLKALQSEVRQRFPVKRSKP
jgi:hypothetical protein